MFVGFFCLYPDSGGKHHRGIKRRGERVSRRVLLHHCKRAEEDDGKKFSCSCTHHLTKQEALDRIARGQAQWKKQITGGRLAEVQNEIVEVQTKVVLLEGYPLHARLVTDGDIVNAYAENVGIERARIERIGESQVETLTALGAATRKRGGQHDRRHIGERDQ